MHRNRNQKLKKKLVVQQIKKRHVRQITPNVVLWQQLIKRTVVLRTKQNQFPRLQKTILAPQLVHVAATVRNLKQNLNSIREGRFIETPFFISNTLTLLRQFLCLSLYHYIWVFYNCSYFEYGRHHNHRI